MATSDSTASLGMQLAAFRRRCPPRTRLVDGTAFRYHITGPGDAAVVILPGLLGEGEMSFQIATFLGTLHRVIVPSWPRPADSAAALVRGIAGILDGESIQSAAVVGASFGGLVAQHFALRYPERVTHLILADTSVPRPSRAMKNRRAARLVAALPSSVVRWLLRRFGKRAMKHADPDGFWAHYTAEVVASLGSEDLAARYRAAADLDASPAIAGRAFAPRTLLLESDDDPIVGQAAARALREAFPAATRHVFHESGHAPFIVCPELAAQVIASFIRKR